jgi:hypothetical protein
MARPIIPPGGPSIVATDLETADLGQEVPVKEVGGTRLAAKLLLDRG